MPTSFATHVNGQVIDADDVNAFNAPINDIETGAAFYGADAGSTDAYAVTLSPAPASYTSGMVVNFKANTANTGAATLNVNSLGAKTIKKNGNQDLDTGDILANQIMTVIYDGTNFQLVSSNLVHAHTPGNTTAVACRAYKSAVQPVSASMSTACQFDAETYDTDSLHNTATNNTRVTVPTGMAGKWLFHGTASFASTAISSYVEVWLRVNGSTSYPTMIDATIASTQNALEVCNVLNLSANDYVELMVWHNNSSALNVSASLEAVWLGA